MKHHHDSTSEIVQSNLPCGACGSRDNAKAYSDGHTYCFGCGAHTQGDDAINPTVPTRSERRMDLVDAGAAQGLGKRKITQETCEHFGYTVSDFKGTPCQVAPYVDRDGQIVAQKVRLPNKDFKWFGADQKTVMPFGYQAFARSGKSVVLTEGEVDALSMSQVQGNKWPVWSIPTGAGPQLRKWLAAVKDAGVFDGFERVVLMFDSDEKGREATQMAAEILGSRAVVAELPLKDANEMLVAGRTQELISAMWNARKFTPSGIIQMEALRDEVLQEPAFGLTYPWQGLDDMTYGTHLGEIITIVAGTGVGKTDVTYEILERLITTHNVPVAGMFLEATPAQAAKLVAGKHAKKRFHIPTSKLPADAQWTTDELMSAFDSVTKGRPAFLYDARGDNSWDSLKAKIEYLAVSEGVKYFVVDNMTSIVGEMDDERKEVDAIMRDMEKTVVSLGITIYLCVHANRPPNDRKSHEEGGRVTLANIRMSGGIAAKSFIVIGLERDQQAEEETVRFTTTVRCLKMRRDGSRVGQVFFVRYNPKTGMLEEVSSPEAPDGASSFMDETQANDQQQDF